MYVPKGLQPGSICLWAGLLEALPKGGESVQTLGWSMGWVAGNERLNVAPMPHLVVLRLPARDTGRCSSDQGTGNSMGTV